MQNEMPDQKTCQKSSKHLELNRPDIVRYHFCDFCYELLSLIKTHEAASCTLFKDLDEEFKDFQSTSDLKLTK